MTPRPQSDTTAATYTQAVAAAAASRTRRGVALCSCGAEFPDTADGRRIHQKIYSHRVTPVTEVTP